MTAGAGFGRVAFSVDSRDHQTAITWVTVGGLVAALVLAAIGGMPFDLPMPTHLLGWVEPSCGLTRGSTAIARGEFGLAWRYNPASFAVMAIGVFGAIRATAGILTGCWVKVEPRIGALGWATLFVGLAVLSIHQQANAEFVMNARL